MADIKELRETYQELYGKKAMGTWKEDKLQDMIDNFDGIKEKSPSKNKEEFKIDPNETYEFELIGRAAKSKTYQISQESKVWDGDNNCIREVRMCPFENSPYKDEQSEDSPVSKRPLSFSYGSLKISGREAYKIKYILALDGLEGKEDVLPQNYSGRNLFRMIDKSAVIDAELKEAEDRLKAGIVVTKSSEGELENFMRSRFGADTVVGKDVKQIKTEALKKAEQVPSLFLVDFNNPKHKLKSQIQKCVEKGDLKVTEGEVYNKLGKPIYKFDAGRHAYDEALARWVLEGSKEAKELESLLEDKS